MHIVNNVGDEIDATSIRAILNNLLQQHVIGENACRLIAAATTNRSLAKVPPQLRDHVRADLFKNMLLVTKVQST